MTKYIIAFALPVGVAYEATLLDYQDDGSKLTITIEVTPEVWETVDLVMLFNLHWDARSVGRISGAKPVQIKMALDEKIYQELKQSNAIPDLNAFVATPDTEEIRSTKAWFGLEVTEEVDLPDSLSHLGTLREGFTTKWRELYK